MCINSVVYLYSIFFFSLLVSFFHTNRIPNDIGEYLKNRTYRGLEANVGEDEAADVLEGLSGIARGYVYEKDGEDKDDK